MSYESDVLAWARHVRSGGTTAWADFWPDAPAGSGGGPLPGATQLELVRRLAQRGGGLGFERLADRVLARDAPGRGPTMLPLAHPERRGGVGALPVDPGDTPVGELLRLGVGVLTDLVLAQPVPRTRARRTRLRRRGSVVIHVPTLDDLLTRSWSLAVQRGASTRWRTFVKRWALRGRLPVAADAARLAAAAAARTAPDRVDVFVGKAAADVEPALLSVESTELLRRVNPLLGLHVGPDRRDGVQRAAVHLLAGGPNPVLSVPSPQRQWAVEQGRRVAAALESGGYCVHGELDELLIRADAPQHVRAEAVLDRLVEVLVGTVREERR